MYWQKQRGVTRIDWIQSAFCFWSLETWGKWWICWGCFGGKRTGTCHSCLSLTSGLPNGEPVIWPFMNTTWLIFNFNEIQLQMKRRDQLHGGCLCLFGFLLSQVRWLNVSQDYQNQGKQWILTYFIAFISCIRRGEAGKKEKESREEEKPFLFLFFFFPAQQALFDPWSVLKCQNNDFDSCGSSNLDSSFGQAVEEVANWILKRGRGRGEKKKKKKKKPHRDHHASFHSFLLFLLFFRGRWGYMSEERFGWLW